MRTVIESLGVYLPPRAVSTQDVLRGCANEVRFPLEKLTGIRSRRMAGDTEFSVDLARNAVADCLAGSRHHPADVDLVIASSVSRCDGPHFRFTYEPGTAVRLRHIFGFAHALAFDIASACTGMFTAIWVADTFLKLGLARCALVVSGEYITALTLSAQPCIRGVLHPQLACLTLGDAGAAVLLEPSADDATGFHDLDLFTLGRYASYCVAKATEQAPVMLTESIRITEISVLPAAVSALEALQRGGWSPDAIDHLIMHQTSRTTLRDAIRLIQSAYPGFSERVNVVDNLSERGNTASTTHFVALVDEILQGRIHSGDRVMFGISGSGQTLGSALYTLDDLPDRVRRRRSAGDQPPRGAPVATASPSPVEGRVAIEAIGVVGPEVEGRPTIELCRAAAEACLQDAARDRRHVGLVLHAGVYRSEHMFEPAIAAWIAGEVGINDVFEPPHTHRTLAFDLFNGAVGFLQACFVALQAIRAGRVTAAMVVASEVEDDPPTAARECVLPRAQVGSAVMLGARPAGASGFGRFLFRTFPAHLDAVVSYVTFESGSAQTVVRHLPRRDEIYVTHVPEVVHELLEKEGLALAQIKAVFPPQISPAFIARLAAALGVAPERCVDATVPGRDLFTSSLPYAMREARRRELVRPGDTGLIIAVGSGVQIGCALYTF